MIEAAELKAWLNRLPKKAEVYVDEGGLTLMVRGSEAYLEVGGNDAMFRMHYLCTKCQVNWSDEWHCTVNSKCPRCRREIGPHTVEDIE